MPQATTTGTQTEHFDLETLPDGYVVVRRMTYGEFLRRKQMVSAMRIQAGQGKGFEGIMDLADQKVVEYEFANCITDHNLEDETGRKLDFRKVADIHKLDPRVGEEIGRYIDKMNQFLTDEEAQGNSQEGSEQAS